MYHHRLTQRRTVHPYLLPLSQTRRAAHENRASRSTVLKRLLFGAILLLAGLAVGWLVAQYGWVRVVGQVGKHFTSPLYRMVSFSDFSKQRMARALPIPDERLPVFVVSLKRASARREYMKQQLDGIDYTLVDAIDGALHDFKNDEDVRTYIGDYRLKLAGLDDKEDCAVTNTCPPNHRVARQQIAVDLTYIKLFREIANDDHLDAAIVLEDDAAIHVPAVQFKESVSDKLRHLPRDWHLFLLYTGERTSLFGPEVAPGIKILRTGVGTVGFVIKKETARYILKVGSWLFPALFVDLVMCGFLVETSLINGYVTQPLAVGHGTFVSTKDVSMLT